MPHVVQTHINALYADLKDAEQAAAVANQKVEQLKEQVRARGGVVPGEELPEAEESDNEEFDEDQLKKGKK